MPAEALAFVVTFENITEDNKNKIDQIIGERGFHPAEVTARDGSLHYQPFENTDKNIQLIETCVGRISDAIPNVEVEYEITRSNRRFTRLQCGITVESEDEVDTGDVGTVDRGVDQEAPTSIEREWRATLATDDKKETVGSSHPQRNREPNKEPTESENELKRQEADSQVEAQTSQRRNEQSRDRHQIHSYADIHHTINYSLDKDSQELVFDSMERGGVTPTDGLDHALETNDVHCSCGKTNLSEQEAVEHLNRAKPTPADSDNNT